MNLIEHIIEPERLLLTWQSSDPNNRMRRIVGELLRANGKILLRYLLHTSDFSEAKKNGFVGYYAFPVEQEVHEDVLDVFLKRIPPRSRGDFIKYLESIRIQTDNISDFALLGYSGAKLPDDDFMIVHPFDNVEGNCEVFTEISGYRHNEGRLNVKDLCLGKMLSLEPEQNNQFDPNSIRIICDGHKLGYINRAQTTSFNRWLTNGRIQRVIFERENGTSSNPRAYIFVEIK